MQIKSKGIVNGVINDKYGKRGNMNLSIPLEFINYPKETKSFALELKAVGDMGTANVTGGSRYGQVMAPGIRENQNRKKNHSEFKVKERAERPFLF